MKPLPRMFWTSIGWVGVALAILAIFIAAVDGVPAVFLLYAAMIVGGVSGIGIHSIARYGLVILAISTLLVLGMRHYVTTTGFIPPSLDSLRQVLAIIAIPLAISAGLLAWGAARRS